jgi:hypothetical protein
MCDVLKCSSNPKILKYESRPESKDNDEQVKKTIKDWFSGLAADFYDAHIQELIT